MLIPFNTPKQISRKRLRAAFIWQGIDRVGGVETILRQFLAHLPRYNIHPYIVDFASPRNKKCRSSVGDDARVMRLFMDSTESSRSFDRRVHDRLRKAAPHLVVLNDFMQLHSLDYIPPAIPLVACCHNADPDPARIETAIRLAPRLRAIVAMSPRLFQRLNESVGSISSTPLGLIHHGVEAPKFPVTHDFASRPLRLVFVGRLVQFEKRVRDIVPFTKHLAALGVPYTLTILGEGDQAPYLHRSLASEMSVGQVRFTGPLDHAATLAHLQKQHILVLFSEFETGPLVLLEALIRGVVPVVTSNDGWVVDVVRRIDHELIFPIGAPDAAARVIARLAQEPARLKALSQSCCDSSRAYTIDEMMTAFAHLFHIVANDVLATSVWAKWFKKSGFYTLRDRAVLLPVFQALVKTRELENVLKRMLPGKTRTYAAMIKRLLLSSK